MGLPSGQACSKLCFVALMLRPFTQLAPCCMRDTGNVLLCIGSGTVEVIVPSCCISQCQKGYI